MANYGTVQRPSTASPSPSTDHPYDPKDSTRKKFNIICPFNIPTTQEAAAARIIRNLGDFGLYYALFIWLGLFIALIPQRKVSLIYLVAMTYVTGVYLLVLRALPNSVVLNNVIDKRLVLALLAIATMVELILTRAAIHLFASLGIGVPLILVHAVLTIRDDLFVGEEATSAADQLVPLRNSNETPSVDIV
ncbi:Prenylated rab acceptor [Trema orientale]|uniref:PRA1 family protein n=1 Tax=Trema orientale TaxID=63057 RepID=A0A2P5FPM9_TREOI|nr:Prenylated rab acceptor [Trema orientale]